MMFLERYFLSALIFVPVAGAVLIALTRPESEKTQKQLGLLFSTAVFALSLTLLTGVGALGPFRDTPDMQFQELRPWIPSLGVTYHLGIDGLSLWLVILTTFLTPLCLLGSWSSIHGRVREFVVLMLLLEAGMIGVFVALDLVLFYIFWEAMLIPMYFLIGIWGHDRRIYAAVKFFLYTFAGSVLMMVAFLVLYRVSGANSFDIPTLIEAPVAPWLQMWLFAACALAFAIKVPMWPFHTWLPDAHVEAPTAGSVILAGVLLKMGGYGFLRLAIPLFPAAAVRFAPWIGLLAVIGIVYGALVSLVQPDLKKLVAYSSVSHLGFVMLGIAAFSTTSVVGAVYQMLNHGISTGALFFMVGMLYDRRHTRTIAEFGGLKSVMPWYAAIFLVVCLSSIAVPGFNGFVGEFLILMGSWRFNPRLPGGYDHLLVAFASLGVILAAGYILWMVKRVLYGEVTNPKNTGLPDLSLRELVVLVPLVVLALFMGVASPLFTRSIEPAANHLIQHVRKNSQLEAPPRVAALPPPADGQAAPPRPAEDRQ
jgi:NADH-quinone oxidoreductase subunit M